MKNARGTRGHFEMRHLTETGAADPFTSMTPTVIITEEHVQKVIRTADEREMHRKNIRRLIESYLVSQGLAVYAEGYEEIIAH